jgi:predicted Rossmann-fold nucleotide-binding protein
MLKLYKVVSGGQTGADLAGVLVAKHFGLKTGGWMPKGFKNQVGYHPDYATIFGMKEHPDPGYKERTWANARDSDGTVRFAGNFGSPGEICTLNGIRKYDKPYFDVDITDPRPIKEFAEWLEENDIEVLNVAGNAESTFKNAETETAVYLIKFFSACAFHPVGDGLNDNFRMVFGFRDPS